MRHNRFFALATGLVLVALLAAGGCSKNRNRASNQAPSSGQAGNLQAAVTGALANDAALRGQHVTASVENGEVTLSGTVQTSQQQQQAETAVARVTGVVGIADRIQLAGDSGQASSSQPASTAPQTPPPPAVLVIPAGTLVRVRLDQDLGSKISQPGEAFSATVADPVVLDGQIVIPRDARAEGTVIDAKPLGRFRGGALLELRLERVRTQWGSYPVRTSTMERVEKGKGGRWAKFAGGGGALGAIIGGVAGGGKGALIGGLAGAGAGTAGSAVTGNREIFLPAETLVTFRLERSVHVTEGQ